MAKVALRWHGLKELRAQLKTLARDLTTDAKPTVQSAAREAMLSMQARYPRRTGRLASSLVLREPQQDQYANRLRLTNTAPYAHYFEYGTRYMPPGRVFIPILNQARRDLTATIAKQTLPRFNFRAHGDVDS